MNDGKLIRKLGNPQDLVMVSRLSPDGQTLIKSGWDSPIIEMWNLKNGTREAFNTGFRRIKSIAFADEGRLVLAWGAPRDQDDFVWYARTDSQEKLGTVFLKNIGNLVSHPLSGEVISVGATCEAMQFQTRPVIASLGDKGGTLSRLAFLGTDDSFIGPSSQYPEGRRRLFWRIKPGESPLVKLRDEAVDHLHYKYRDFHATLDGNRFLAFSSFPKYRYMALYERKSIGDGYEVVSEGQIESVPDGIPAWGASTDALRFWCRDGIFDSVTRKRLATLEFPPNGEVTQAEWSRDGNHLTGLVTRRHEDGLKNEYHVVNWDTQAGRIIRQRRMNAPMNVVKHSPDGKRLAVGGADKSIRFLDAETLEEQSRLRAHDKAVIDLAWHPSRPFLVTASHDLNLKLWNLASHKLVETIRHQKEPTINLTFSPSGKFLACYSEEATLTFFWDMRDLLASPATFVPPPAAPANGAAKPTPTAKSPSKVSAKPVKTGDWIPTRDSGTPLRELKGFNEISRDADLRINVRNNFEQHNQNAGDLMGGNVPVGTDFLFHTAPNMTNPHIVIRLSSESEISALKVVNRPGQSTLARAEALTLWLSSDEKTWRQVWQADSVAKEWLIELPDAPKARYLKIGLPRKGTLHLREVVVFGQHETPGNPQ